MSSALRVVLDTKVLLSGLAYPGSVPGRIMAAWRHGSVEVVLSDFILEETRRVLPRLSSRHGLSVQDMDDLVDLLALYAEVVSPQAVSEPLLRDVNDAAILGTLLAAMTAGLQTYLITGDKDLLALSGQYPVLTPAQFWQRHGGV